MKQADTYTPRPFDLHGLTAFPIAPSTCTWSLGTPHLE